MANVVDGEIHIAARPVGRSKARWRPGLVAGTAILVASVLIALGADWISPHDPYSQSLARRLRPPVWDTGGSTTYLLGTDAFGRDYLSRLIYATQVSLIVGFGAAAVAGLIGTLLGVVAGYFRGWTDTVVSFVISARLAMPAILLALAILQIAGSGLAIVVLVLALTHWDRFAVVMRTATIQVRHKDYILRARAVGCSTPRIIFGELFPNIIGPFLVIFTFEIAQTILAATALSFLGIGIRAPTPSWGLMMAEGRGWMLTNPWLITIAGLALMLLILGINLVGDGLRDMFGFGRKH
jgi:peptide/nickel transport system permease protein